MTGVGGVPGGKGMGILAMGTTLCPHLGGHRTDVSVCISTPVPCASLYVVS